MSGPRSQGRVAARRLQAGGYDPRVARNAQARSRGLDSEGVVSNASGKTNVLHDETLAEVDGELGVALERVASMLAGNALYATGDKIGVRPIDNVPLLTQSISSPPTQAQAQLIQSTLNEVILAMRRAGQMKEL